MDLGKTRYRIVLVILLVVIGAIFIKSDFYLGNPTLALMNYKLYYIRYTRDNQQYECIVISKERLKKNDYIEAIPFDDKAWYVKRSTIEDGGKITG